MAVPVVMPAQVAPEVLHTLRLPGCGSVPPPRVGAVTPAPAPTVAFAAAVKAHDGLSQVPACVDELMHAFFVDKAVRTAADLCAVVTGAAGWPLPPLRQLHTAVYLHVLDLVHRLQRLPRAGQAAADPAPARQGGVKRARAEHVPAPAVAAPRAGKRARSFTPGPPPPHNAAAGVDPAVEDDAGSGGSADTSDPGEDAAPAASRGLLPWAVPARAAPCTPAALAAAAVATPAKAPTKRSEGCRVGGGEDPCASPTTGGGGGGAPASPPSVPVLPQGGGRALKMSRVHLPYLVVLARLYFKYITTLPATPTRMPAV